MTRSTVTTEIQRLEALSRQRELSNCESWRLQKMLTVERRYDWSRRRHVAHSPDRNAISIGSPKAGAPAEADAPTPRAELPARREASPRRQK